MSIGANLKNYVANKFSVFPICVRIFQAVFRDKGRPSGEEGDMRLL